MSARTGYYNTALRRRNKRARAERAHFFPRRVCSEVISRQNNAAANGPPLLSPHVAYAHFLLTAFFDAVCAKTKYLTRTEPLARRKPHGRRAEEATRKVTHAHHGGVPALVSPCSTTRSIEAFAVFFHILVYQSVERYVFNFPFGAPDNPASPYPPTQRRHARFENVTATYGDL